MDFLVEIDVLLPAATDEETLAALTKAEAVRAGELAAEGRIYRLWRIPGRWSNVGIWRAGDATELHESLSSLPLYKWLNVRITPLARHPNDPGGPA